MNSLEEKSTKKLYNLLKLLVKGNPGKLEDWEDNRDLLIEVINEDMFYKGYQGEDNYDSMYNYIKGQQLPAPKSLQRYDQSDDYFFRNLKKKVGPVKDQLGDMIRDNLQKKFRRVTRHNPFIKDLPNQANKMKEFNRQYKENNYDYIGIDLDPIQRHIYRMNDYREWLKESNPERQQALVNETIERLQSNPDNWKINFDEFTDEGKRLLLPQLIEFFETFVDTLPITRMYRLNFWSDGQWKGSKPFTPELYAELMKNLNEGTFIYSLDEAIPELAYEFSDERTNDTMPDLRQFSAISLESFNPKNETGSKKKEINSHDGGFFRYLTNGLPKKVIDYVVRLQIFDSLVDEENKERKELRDSCFVYALKQVGFCKEVLNKIRLRLNNRHQSQSNIDALCREFKIHLKLHYINEDAKGVNKKRNGCITHNKSSRNYLGVPEKDSITKLEMNLFEKHYFIEERTPFSSYYINHIDTMNEDQFNKLFDGDHYKKAPENRLIKSGDMVRVLLKNGYFKPITYGQYKVLNTVFHNDVKENTDYDLEYNEEYCTQLIAPIVSNKSVKRKVQQTSYWFCDFEADVSGEIHVPYMCVLHSLTGVTKEEFRGEDCNEQLLDFLPEESIVFFHNLAYDIRMLARFGITGSIRKGNRVLKTEIEYKGKKLLFKDTLPILSCKLEQLPRMFGINDVQKEIFPYKYYTLKRLEANIGVISEAGADEDKFWGNAEYKLFNENIDKIDGCRLDEDHFDMWKYASFYCQQDVRILRLGFNEFRKGFLKDFHIDPFKYISISSLANEVFNQRVYYPNKNLYKLGGHVRHFCSQAVYGGRCMCAYNKKWNVQRKLSDFDAVSLYPSAMARLYTVEGRPSVIEPHQLNLEFLSKQSAYIVEINITKVNKHYAFPLIVRKVNGLNLNDDHIAPGEKVRTVVDNITLEDLINYQQIEFEFVKGYYWSGARDYTIQKEIRNIFDKRVEYKKKGNPLQQLYKLIMNSCYGKTIERPVEKDYRYIREGEDLDRYWKSNYYKIIEDIQLENCDIHAVKTLRPIDKHFNFSLLGIQVLSMSKRIMNEVMCLAFDLGCHIYYQDTDSMHIEVDDLPRLEKEFESKYGRKLVGSDLGQFHSDFAADNGREDVKYAVESIFLMKKMYIDRLLMEDDTHENMIRGKGLTSKSIKYAADTGYEGNVLQMYREMFMGEPQTFDLTKGQPCFAMNKNLTVSTLKKFCRNVKVTYEPGCVDDYFRYGENN